jgi:hypothetical protein
MRRHYDAIKRRRLRAIEHWANNSSAELKIMLIIRLYICALTFLFLLLVITNRGLGILEAIVITCAIVYLILDVRSDLHALKSELQLLETLEERVAAILR